MDGSAAAHPEELQEQTFPKINFHRQLSQTFTFSCNSILNRFLGLFPRDGNAPSVSN